jgi:hypothetical protein
MVRPVFLSLRTQLRRSPDGALELEGILSPPEIEVF